MNIYIDESGSINNHIAHMPYFIVAMVHVMEKDKLSEYSGVKYITRPAIGNQSSVFVEITIPANRKSLYLINPYNEIIRHLV